MMTAIDTNWAPPVVKLPIYGIGDMIFFRINAAGADNVTDGEDKKFDRRQNHVHVGRQSTVWQHFLSSPLFTHRLGT